jgi:hypothetical protein
MFTFIPLAVFAIAVVVAYFRCRGHFSDLAAATDSKRSRSFWTIVAWGYAVVLVLALGVYALR